MSKKASLSRSFGLLVLSLVLVLGFRWIAFEPFVIPSGSMIPTLMVNDHIVVAKYRYGIRVPFTRIWLVEQKLPARGDIVVFRSREKDDFFMIKRVVGLPGDTVEFNQEGLLLINGKPVPRQAAKSDESWGNEELGGEPIEFDFWQEELDRHSYITAVEKRSFRFNVSGYIVPEGHIFLMGDNRDRSRDSRFWGPLPVENLLGEAKFVWLACSKTFSKINFICDPRAIRWQRIFSRIQ